MLSSTTTGGCWQKDTEMPSSVVCKMWLQHQVTKLLLKMDNMAPTDFSKIPFLVWNTRKTERTHSFGEGGPQIKISTDVNLFDVFSTITNEFTCI
jgi:hypothetical protein